MPKKALNPVNLALIKELRERNIDNGQIAKIVGIGKGSLIRAVHALDLPLRRKKTKAKPFVVAQYVHHTGSAPISLEEMAARPKVQTITEKRAVAYVPPKADDEKAVSFGLAESLSRGELPKAEEPIRVYESALDMMTDNRPSIRILPLAAEYKDWNDQISNRRRDDNPFRLKARVSEFNRNRRAILEDIEGEIDKVFRKFRTLAGPNTRIEDPEIFKLLSADARVAYDHLQALIAAARVLREANGAIVEVAIHLHNAGAAATRATP